MNRFSFRWQNFRSFEDTNWISKPKGSSRLAMGNMLALHLQQLAVIRSQFTIL
jgi:hypothetical protein